MLSDYVYGKLMENIKIDGTEVRTDGKPRCQRSAGFRWSVKLYFANNSEG